MSRLCPLFSSSKGNSTYISGGGATLLIDAGVSLRQLSQALAEHDLTPGQLDGVLITHEHTDHIKGLPMLLQKYRIPLYASRETAEYLCLHGYVPGTAQVEELTGPTVIAGIQVTPFDTPHDACHSTGFRFEMPDGRRIAVATDLGHITETVRAHITGCDVVMLESNYDQGMLESSPYPYTLKRRIRGDYGHLSNEDCSCECIRLIENGTSHLMLAHLSEQNNLPALARQVAKATLESACMKEDRDYVLRVAPARGYSAAMVF